ncbi:MAG: hypothetical protein NW207_05570 [Cytophagales bacterium]|nr:hypothetical protein [Cytophagales bacterium]
MHSTKLILYSIGLLMVASLIFYFFNSETGDAKKNATTFDDELQRCNEEYNGINKIFDYAKYNFGIGTRGKYTYANGVLLNSKTGRTIRSWHKKSEIINYAQTRVILTTEAGLITIYEDTEGIFIKEGYKISAVEKKNMKIPDFTKKKYPLVTKALYQIYMYDTANVPVKQYYQKLL